MSENSPSGKMFQASEERLKEIAESLKPVRVALKNFIDANGNNFDNLKNIGSIISTSLQRSLELFKDIQLNNYDIVFSPKMPYRDKDMKYTFLFTEEELLIIDKENGTQLVYHLGDIEPIL